MGLALDKEGKGSTKTEDICSGLIVSEEMFDLIAQFRQLKPIKSVSAKKEDDKPLSEPAES